GVAAAPFLAGGEFLVGAVVAPDPARGLVVGGDEAVAIAHAAIVRGLHLVPDDEAVGVEAAVVDADRLDLAADHHAIEPRPRPFDPAFEMGAALGDARRTQHAGRDGGAPGLARPVHRRFDRQSADRTLIEHGLLEGPHFARDLAGGERVVGGVLVGAAGERDVHGLVADGGAGPERRGVDAALPVDGRDQ